jgi:hypothetical protein
LCVPNTKKKNHNLIIISCKLKVVGRPAQQCLLLLPLEMKTLAAGGSRPGGGIRGGAGPGLGDGVCAAGPVGFCGSPGAELVAGVGGPPRWRHGWRRRTAPPDPALSRPVLEAARQGRTPVVAGAVAGASVGAAVLAGGAPVAAVVGVWGCLP